MLVARLLVPLSIPRRSSTRVHQASGASLLTAAGLSLAVHLALVVMVAAAPPATDIEAPLAGDSSAVSVMISALVEEDPPLTAAADGPLTTTTLTAAPVRPVRRPRPRRAPLPPVAALAVSDGVPAPTAAPVVERTSPPPPVVESTSPSPARPLQVSPEMGRGLRLEDDYPQLPPSLRNLGFQHEVLIEVCVSVRGAVDDIRFASHTTGELRQDLERAIRGWRYRPLWKDGALVPFCHQMRIQYRMT